MGSEVPSWIELTQSPPGRVWSGDDWVIFEGRWQDSPPAGVDHVISDPPYGKRVHRGTFRRMGTGGGKGIQTKAPISFDPVVPGALVPELPALARRWTVLFCEIEAVGEYWDAGGEWYVRGGIAVRKSPVPQLSADRPGVHGDCIVLLHQPGRKRWNGRGRPARWWLPQATGGTREASVRVHETQKPLSLMRQLVEDFTDPGEIVWDPYAGSATTGVACLQLGRRFVGHEMQAHYAEIAAERLQAAAQGLTLRDARAGQIPLFGGGND